MRRRVAVDGARAVARRLLTVLEPPNCTLAQLRKRSSKLQPDHRMCDDISAGHRQSRWLRCASLDILLLRHRYRQSRWLYRASQDILLLRHIVTKRKM